jgi:serine/threonine-protein kinase
MGASRPINRRSPERYALLELAGGGCDSSVWRGRWHETGDVVAVKILSPGATRPSRMRFACEAWALRALSSPGIVDLVDSGENQLGLPYLVMSWLEGVTLKAHLATHGAMTPEAMLTWLAPIFDGAAHMHESGVVHRDINPSNIMLIPDERAKLVDFGSVLIMGSRGFGGLVGTPRYTSPEQACGINAGSQADLWSLAAVAYECLVGRPAFGRNALSYGKRSAPPPVPTPPSQRTEHAGAALDGWFDVAFSALPEQRFANAPQMFDALSGAVASERAR